MHHRTPVLRTLTVLGVFTVVLALAVPSSVTAQAAPFCPPGQAPRFLFGFATLKARLGATMGEPIECEHVNSANGDTLQNTTAGLAYYRAAINTPMFTNGTAHYALSGGSLLLWQNDSIDPPQPTVAESTYLATTTPLLERVDELAGQLGVLRLRASQGQINTIPVSTMGSVLDQLTTARQQFANADESARLSLYDDTVLRSIDVLIESAENLLQARITDIPAARAAFLAEAMTLAPESGRLRQEATEAYSQALPIVIG